MIPALLCGGEFVSLGVKGGMPMADVLDVVSGTDASYFTDTKRYLVGRTFGVHLPALFSMEVDALYKRIGYQYQAGGPFVYSKTVANT